MKKLAILMMGAAVALSSCSKEEASIAGVNSVSFATSEIETRVADNNFEASDVISVQAFAGAEVFGTKDYTFIDSATGFTSSDPFTYTSDNADKSLSYQAVYPAMAEFSNEFTHSINADQSVAENVEASDLLTAVAEATTSLKPTLAFTHRMSMVNLAVVITRDGVESTEETIENLKINAAIEATCNIAEDSYVVAGDVAEITPAADGSVIVAPQDIAATGFATATVNGTDFEMNNAAATLASGYVYDLKWTIDIATGSQKVEFLSASIGGWESADWGGDDTTGGDGNTGGGDDTTTTPAQPIELTLDCDAIMTAMGETTVPSGTGLPVANAEFDNFTLNSDKGTGSTPFRLWTDKTIRSYAGNTVTVTAKNGKKIVGVEFDVAISDATVGTADGKTWAGEADEVVLTVGKGEGNTITVTVK